MKNLALTLHLVCYISCFINISEAKHNYNCIKPNIEIVVAPSTKKLQINWEIEKALFKNGDWIGLYQGDTDTNAPNKNRKYVFKLDKEKGWATSDITFDGIIEKNFHAPVVLKWKAIYWRNHGNGRFEALVTSKLSTFPDWMKHYWDTIKNKPLFEIFIPGTHDSVCDETISLQINPGLKKVNSFKAALGSFKTVALQTVGSTGIGDKLTMTQDMDITEQLLLGIRYLDIRVILADNGEYWAGHGGIAVIKLNDVIDKVKEFADKTEKELIIFDMHQFMEFKNEKDHTNFINYLRKKFTDNNKTKWIPPVNSGWTTHLDKLLTPERKIILSYNDHNRVTNHGKGFLWYPVKQLWGDKQQIQDLLLYFKSTFNKNEQPNNICHAAMAQLTPLLNSAQKILDNARNGLKVQAEENAGEIYNLFMTKEIGLKTNILATDFFMGMGTVRQAFIWNTRKFQQDRARRHCDPEDKYDDMYYQHNITD